VSPQEITPREALLRLGSSTAEAIGQVLEMFVPGAVERGDVSVLAEGASPFASLPPGAVASSVSYVDGVSGANIFVLPAAGARKLATAMGVPAPETETGSAELSELELSAVAEAANQMMAAAATAIGGVLGQEIEISPPDTRVLSKPASASEVYGTAPHLTSTTFLISGESCRLIQLVPSAFVVRMARAIDERSAVAAAGEGGLRGAGQPPRLKEVLGDIRLRVWAELGRTRMPLGKALALPLGAVVDLDRPADAPVDLFVNGVRFASGHLVINDDEWAVSLDELIAPEMLAQVALGVPDEVQGPGNKDAETESPLEGALT
jgi:flagellar motor switch protein FliN/FliY